MASLQRNVEVVLALEQTIKRVHKEQKQLLSVIEKEATATLSATELKQLIRVLPSSLCRKRLANHLGAVRKRDKEERAIQ